MNAKYQKIIILYSCLYWNINKWFLKFQSEIHFSTANLSIKDLLIDTHIGYSTTKLNFDFLMEWSYFKGQAPLVKNMNFNLKLRESFNYTLIQINTKEQNYLITFQMFDPPYLVGIQKDKLSRNWLYSRIRYNRSRISLLPNHNPMYSFEAAVLVFAPQLVIVRNVCCC